LNTELDRRRKFPSPWAAIVAMLVFASGCGPDYDYVANLDSAGSAIVCFGDSLTRGYGVEAGRDYPSQLSRLLGEPIINAGRDGDTTGSALERLDEDVLVHAPRLVIVELSGNDFLKRVPKEETFANLDQIVARCVAAGAMVVLVHAKFGLWSDPYIQGFEEIAEKHGALLVENVLNGILTNPKRMYDRIHPNEEGYRLMAERVAEVVRPLLEEAEARERTWTGLRLNPRHGPYRFANEPAG
jgi:acyl-CoA thioesterase-1